MQKILELEMQVLFWKIIYIFNNFMLHQILYQYYIKFLPDSIPEKIKIKVLKNCNTLLSRVKRYTDLKCGIQETVFHILAVH